MNPDLMTPTGVRYLVETLERQKEQLLELAQEIKQDADEELLEIGEKLQAIDENIRSLYNLPPGSDVE